MLKEQYIQRMGIIFQALKAGKTADEVDLLLQDPNEQTYKVGLASEMRVKSVLRKSPSVSGVHRVKPFSPPDMQGRDLIVYLNESHLPRVYWLRKVYVQVKSSHGGILSDRELIRRKFCLLSNQVDGYLKAKKMIFLNGQSEEETIHDYFVEQLQEIREFFTR